MYAVAKTRRQPYATPGFTQSIEPEGQTLNDRPAVLAIVVLCVAVLAAALADGVFTPDSAPGAAAHRPADPAKPAGCARARCRNVELTIHSVVVKPVAPGFIGNVVDAGLVTGSFGRGLSSIDATFPTPDKCSPSGCAFVAHVRSFFDNGGFTGTMTGVDKLHPDGSASAEGSGEIKAGTFAYKGARGTFTFTSFTPKGSDVTTVRLRGAVILRGRG